MKRFVVLVLVGLMVFGCVGCSEEQEEKTYDLALGMREMTTSLNNENQVADVDLEALNRFCDALHNTKFRVRGMVTEYEITQMGSKSCQIVCGEFKVHTFLSDDEDSTDGEYIEVIGGILTMDEYEGYGSPPYRASFVLHNASIVERGASVRERIESENPS